jgi:pyridoxal phosphate enzyme (YggS family)
VGSLPAFNKNDGEALKKELEIIRRKMITAYRNAPDSSEPHLIAVSKTIPPEGIIPLLAAGHRVFGENRVQEAKDKWPALKERYEGVKLHLIGALQTNKVREALDLFDVIHTLDRPRLAHSLAAERDKGATLPQLLVQVNTGAEPQKAGIRVEDLPHFLNQCAQEFGLNIEGLMCIPPVDEAPAPHFALLAKLAKRHNLPLLSMGMSADFETAIAYGATHVRVGSALFGARAETR